MSKVKKEFAGVKKKEEPEKIDVKIGSVEEELWTRVRDEAKMLIKNHEQSLIVQKAMLDLAIQKISEEQAKIKE